MEYFIVCKELHRSVEEVAQPFCLQSNELWWKKQFLRWILWNTHVRSSAQMYDFARCVPCVVFMWIIPRYMQSAKRKLYLDWYIASIEHPLCCFCCFSFSLFLSPSLFLSLSVAFSLRQQKQWETATYMCSRDPGIFNIINVTNPWFGRTFRWSSVRIWPASPSNTRVKTRPTHVTLQPGLVSHHRFVWHQICYCRNTVQRT